MLNVLLQEDDRFVKYQNDSTYVVTTDSKSYAQYYCTNYSENVEYMNVTTFIKMIPRQCKIFGQKCG